MRRPSSSAFRRLLCAVALLGLSACSRAESPADAVVRLPAAAETSSAPETRAAPAPLATPAWVEDVRYVAHDVADVDLTYPRVHLPNAAAGLAVSTHVHDWAMANVAWIERDAEDAASEIDLPPDMPRFALNIVCTTPVVTDNLVSLRCDVAIRDGGAHPSWVAEAFNFEIDGDSARPIGLDDLFLDPKVGRATLGAACLASLRTQEALWVTRGNVIDLHEMLDTFHVERGALVVTFAPYEVGPFAEGPHLVRVPLTSLLGLRPAWAGRLAAIR